MTSEELAFIAALDAEPENHFLRCVYADWLDDRGDPRGPGMRALGRLERKPCLDGMVWYWLFLCVGHPHFGSHVSECLPQCWLTQAMFDTDFKSRAAAEDAAAIAWAKLTPEQQARILADAGVMV